MWTKKRDIFPGLSHALQYILPKDQSVKPCAVFRMHPWKSIFFLFFKIKLRPIYDLVLLSLWWIATLGLNAARLKTAQMSKNVVLWILPLCINRLSKVTVEHAHVFLDLIDRHK